MSVKIGDVFFYGHRKCIVLSIAMSAAIVQWDDGEIETKNISDLDTGLSRKMDKPFVVKTPQKDGGSVSYIPYPPFINGKSDEQV